MISSVVDIGSNSIKLLVARGENAEPLFEALSETRLSPDAESARERISDEAFAAGVDAVRALAEQARAFSPAREAVVGTSLFRTAENARAFADAVFRATGTPMRILSGREEAELVA
ncbi:MAG TPA: phosphatase, partial [Candidatus Spyradosoma merdigallinarum]|nr:phosphatase [Candidatus Spyradosoma merdigallinarum]